jgi:hypothetical protein
MNEDQLIAAIQQRAFNPATRTDFAERWHRELGPPASADAIEAAGREMGCHFTSFTRVYSKRLEMAVLGPAMV